MLLLSGYESMEAAAFIDIFGWNKVCGDHSTSLFTCGVTRTVCASFGPRTIVDYLIGEIDPKEYDALVIPGGFGRYGYYEDGYQDECLELVKSFDQEESYIAAICTGSLILARSGILKGMRATTYATQTNSFAEDLTRQGALFTLKNPVREGKIFTASNPASATKVGFLLLKLLTNAQNAARIQKDMGF